VYEVKLRRAGYAVAYAGPAPTGAVEIPLRINKYYDTLRKALEGELAAMGKELAEQDCDGTEGQDRESYSDDQDRKSYAVCEEGRP
jgi:hypothetical protein